MSEFEIGNAKVYFNSDSNAFIFNGSLRLSGMKEYQKVRDFLDENFNSNEELVTLDLKSLEFLNSSGITMFSMYILNRKKNNDTKVKVVGSNAISWQKKSIVNFSRLWNEVEVEFQD